VIAKYDVLGQDYAKTRQIWRMIFNVVQPRNAEVKDYLLKKIYLFANKFNGKRAQNVRVWCIENMKRGK